MTLRLKRSHRRACQYAMYSRQVSRSNRALRRRRRRSRCMRLGDIRAAAEAGAS
ncbi:MAG: hypothetical protein ACRDRH_10280 [Pseudonocardia sp.]